MFKFTEDFTNLRRQDIWIYFVFQKLLDGILPFEGKIDLKTPDEVYYLLEDYGKQSKNAAADPEHVYFGRWVSVLCDRFS
jgi:hypothetical protein